jgi:hypothetical protein
MSLFTRIKDALFGNWLRSFFTKDNLLQPSTWKGLIRIAVASGVFTISPEVEDTLIQLVLQIIATGTLATGVIDAIRNENKNAKLPWRK